MTTIKRNTLLLIIIICLAAYLRFVGVFTDSFALTYDVGRDLLHIRELVYHHKIPLIGFTTGVEGIFYGPWWYYILSLPFFVSGGNPQFIAGFIALTGVLTVYFLYYLGKKLDSPVLGLIISFLVAVSPSLVSVSSQIWNPNIAPLLICFSLLILINIYKRPSGLLFFLFGVTACLLIDTEIVFGTLLFFGMLFSVILLFRKKFFKKQALYLIPGFLIILLPRIIFELRHNFLMSHSFLNLLTEQKQANTSVLGMDFMHKINIFLDLFADTFSDGFRYPGILFLIFIIICSIYSFKKFTSLSKKIFLLSIIVILTFVIGIMLFRHDIWAHYLVGLPVFYCLFAALPLYYFLKSIRFGNYLLLIILLVIFWLNVNPLKIISGINKPLWIGDASVYRNQLSVLDYVYKSASGKPFSYIVYSPAVFAYPYEYLFLWYGEKKYHYSPKNGQEKLFFVIIEPEKERPLLLKEWLKLRSKDGKIIKEQKLKGGILVQTRKR